MKPRLSLHMPGVRDMDYRQRILAQPETMSYNAGQALDAEGYDVATGCIDFPMTDWRFWRDVWLWREPSRYSAYVRDDETGAFVGEVVLRQEGEPGCYEMGVVIEACHRGKGYSTEAMALLLDVAFNRLGGPAGTHQGKACGEHEKFFKDQPFLRHLRLLHGGRLVDGIVGPVGA